MHYRGRGDVCGYGSQQAGPDPLVLVPDRAAGAAAELRRTNRAVEIPDLGLALKAIKDLDPSIDLEHAICFGTRDLVIRKPGSTLRARARRVLFAFLYRNAVKVVDRFHLPASDVVEIARLIAI